MTFEKVPIRQSKHNFSFSGNLIEFVQMLKMCNLLKLFIAEVRQRPGAPTEIIFVNDKKIL